MDEEWKVEIEKRDTKWRTILRNRDNDLKASMDSRDNNCMNSLGHYKQPYPPIPYTNPDSVGVGRSAPCTETQKKLNS